MKQICFSRRSIFVVGLVLLLALSGCGPEESGPMPATDKTAEKAAPIRVETVKQTPLKLTLALTGSVEAGRIAQLASPVEGPVLGVSVGEGDLVKSGQVLLGLGHTEGATALVDSLREDLKKEEDNLDRTRRLVASGALAGEQLDIAAANMARIRAQLTKAQETTRDYAVRAPWAGVVSKMRVRDGDFVAPRAPLAEIYDPASLIVRLSAPEQEAVHLEPGMQAEVELDAYPGERFSAHISRLYPYLDNHTRSRIVEITFAQAPVLLPGMFARARIVRETIADAITVPAYSLVTAAGGMEAFVVQDGKAVRRKVETGSEVNGRVRILTGLVEGDRLIVAGQEKLKDGAAVKVLEVDGKQEGGTPKAEDKEAAMPAPPVPSGQGTQP